MEERMIHTEIFECGLIIAVSHFDTKDDELVLTILRWFNFCS